MNALLTAATGTDVQIPGEVQRYTSTDSEARQLIQMGPRMSWASELRSSLNVFVLKSPLKIAVSYDDDGLIVASHQTLPVKGVGFSLREALDDFAAMFQVQWEALVDCNVSELAPSGVRARQALEAAVQEVRHAQ